MYLLCLLYSYIFPWTKYLFPKKPYYKNKTKLGNTSTLRPYKVWTETFHFYNNLQVSEALLNKCLTLSKRSNMLRNWSKFSQTEKENYIKHPEEK